MHTVTCLATEDLEEDLLELVVEQKGEEPTTKDKKKRKKDKGNHIFALGLALFGQHPSIQLCLDSKKVSVEVAANLNANFQQLQEGDAATKLMKNMVSEDFVSWKCNCYSNTKENGHCTYGEKCQTCFVIHKSQC